MNYLSKKSFAILAIIALVFTACKKVKTAEPMGDEGQTLVKIIGGGTPFAIIKDPVDFVNVPQTLTKGVVDIRRDVPNNEELDRAMTVTVKVDDAAVAAANPGYIVLPAAFYTLTVADNVPNVGGTWAFIFKPGEFAKQIYVNIPNAQLLDPSALYALGFTITSADADGIITSQKTVVVEIGAKNAWDGIYAVTGPMSDVVSPALVQWNGQANPTPFSDAHAGAWGLHLITTGATQCVMWEDDLYGNYYHPIYTGAATSTFGTFGLVVNFDPVTNKVASVYNKWGETSMGGTGAPLYQSSLTRWAELDPTGINAVQGNKDILIKYFMYQPSVVAGVRTRFDEKWEYVGAR